MHQVWWHPDALLKRRRALAIRGQVVDTIRAFFKQRGYVEVETAYLQRSPGLEPHLQAFGTALHTPQGDRHALYLHTSPEFAMKKLLVAGEPKLFQLARVWRNAEGSPTHHPEFTMLEWYAAGAGYRDIMAECEALLRAVLTATGQGESGQGESGQGETGQPEFRWRGRACDPFVPWDYVSVPEAFQRHCGIDLMATLPETPVHDPDPAPLAAAARAIGITPHEGDRWEDIFFRIALDRIEPYLGMGAPTILYDYPVNLAALSRPKPDNPRLAERFELYVAGVELANAFGELTDPVQQRARFEADMDLKQRLYGERYPIDEGFLAALEFGLPDCAGIALGVDRLAMLAAHADRIEDVLWAPVALPGSGDRA